MYSRDDEETKTMGTRDQKEEEVEGKEEEEEEDDRFDETLSRARTKNQIQSPKQVPTRKTNNRRDRKISLFNVNDLAKERLKMSMDHARKGEFSIVHYDKSRNQAAHENSHGFFENHSETPKYRRSVTSLLSESRSSYKNTLEPLETENRKYDVEPRNRFSCTKVRQIIQEEFASIKHLPSVLQKMACKELCDKVKKKVKELNFSRYRYVVFVTMGTDRKQSLVMATSFFWDNNNDNFVTESMKIDDEFVVVTVFGVYLE